MPNVGSKHTCLVVISLDSAVKKDERYYRKCFKRMQMHWKRKKIVIQHITEDIESFSSNSNEEYFVLKKDSQAWKICAL